MEYNLNVIKEVRVTDSFQSMGKDIKGCQEESYDECTTRKYVNDLMNKCQCLPFQFMVPNKVVSTRKIKTKINKQNIFISDSPVHCRRS